MIAKFLLDEPWTFLNARKNPVEGRRLTFQLEDGTIIIIDVTMPESRNKALIKAKLETAIDAHESLKDL